MLYAIKNLRSQSTFEVAEPWSVVPTMVPPAERGKDAVTAWNNDPCTEHVFYSGYEGYTSGVRVSSDNPPFQMHALILDIDHPQGVDAAELLKTKAPMDIKPQWLTKTPSGNSRLIWLFERPITCGDARHMKEFRKQMYKHMRLARWMGVPDMLAYDDFKTYYALGSDWQPIDPEGRIPMAHLEMWFVKAADGMHFDEGKKTSYSIPYEDLAVEVEARFPGRWQGPFAQGERGVRFWDNNADNQTAAVVTPDGMICYTGDEFFVPWKRIFGASFVDKYETAFVAGIIEHAAYDGQEFWIEDEGKWSSWGKQDFTQDLRCRGYDSSRKKGQTFSEIDNIENLIKKHKKVTDAKPFLYFTPGRITYNHKPYLNISDVVVKEPGAPVTQGRMVFSDGRKHFPFIYKLLVSLFTDNDDEDSDQLTALLAWIKYFYENSRNRTPNAGHLLIIAGPPGKGKSMFVNEVLGQLMGARPVDGTGLLLDGERWTDEIVESPIMIVDDAVATTDYKGMKKFTARLKKYVANSQIKYEKKYKSGGGVPWFGRIVILCNTDPESLKILPDPDSSTLDKFSMLKASEPKIRFPAREEITRMVTQEIAYFARFLLDWEIPERWMPDEVRFGVRSFHHPDLLDEARQQGVGTVLEILDGFMHSYTDLRPECDVWRGPASLLMEDLAAYRPEAMKAMRERSLTTQMGILMRNGYSIDKCKNPRGIPEWVISKNVATIRERKVS